MFWVKKNKIVFLFFFLGPGAGNFHQKITLLFWGAPNNFFSINLNEESKIEIEDTFILYVFAKFSEDIF